MENVLIYRLGSLGDTLLALPALHAVKRRYPRSRVTLLTNRPVHVKAPPMLAVLEHSGLVDDVIDYDLGLRSWEKLQQLRRTIRGRNFSLAINLAEARGWAKSFRDFWFLRSCGISKVIGTAWRGRDLRCQADPRSGLYEWEADRLARRVRKLGEVRSADPELWDLRLSETELVQARETLRAGGIGGGFLALSVGTKVEVKDWTEPNWLGLMQNLRATHPNLPIVAVGSAEESDRSKRCLALWPGPTLNLCGQISVRAVAAVLDRARLFIGHDSGPMHLAATMGVPCVAIFAARNLPGQWFPRGHRNAVIYHQTECFGCGLEVCTAHQKKCILGISVDEVAAAVRQRLPALKIPVGTL